MARVVVTGCSGRVGRGCVRALVGGGHEVFGVDAQGGREQDVRVYLGDLRDPYVIHRALDVFGGEVDAVVHLANHTTSQYAPAEQVQRENLGMNTSVITAAFDRGVHRLVFCSSVQAALGGIEEEMQGRHGPPPLRLPIDESVQPRPTNAYGVSKLVTERMLELMVAQDERRSAVSVRLPAVMTDAGFQRNAGWSGTTELHWGRVEAFSYVHVDDAGEALRLACEAEVEGHEAVWAVAPDPRVPDPVESIVERVYAAIPGAEACVERGGFWDCSRAEELLGWRAGRILSDARHEGT